MRKTKRRWYLNGEELFRKYWSLTPKRSIIRVKKWLKEKEVKSKMTGTTPQDMAIWKAMWRWAIKNEKASFDIVINVYRDNGEYLNEELWHKELIKKSISACQDGKIRI